MSTQYIGDNLIPGVNVKNINSAIIDPMLNLGNQIGSVYDQYGKGLQSALGQDQEDFAQQFLAGKLPGQKQLQRPSADLRGSITPGSLQPAASNLGEGAAMDAAERHRAGAGFPAGVTRPSDYPISSSTKKITSEDSELPSAPVYDAEEQVKKHGVKKAEDLAMMEWAKAHKGLAEKVKPGQAGYDAIQLALGKTTVEPEDIRGFMDDSGKSAEEARAILGGGSVETVIDGDKPMVTTINQAPAPDNQKGAETFKNFAIGALQGLDIGKYKDLGYNPFQIDAGKLLDQSVDFNIPGLEGTLGNYGTADYGELLKKYPNVFSYK